MTKYNAILKKIVSDLKLDQRVKGVILFGSLARKTTGDHNDIDLFAITKERWNQRKTLKKEGVLIEIFYFPYNHIIDRCKTEKKMFMVQMIINGKILYESNKICHQLQKEAKKILKDRLVITQDDKKSMGYFIADALFDIEKQINKNKVDTLYLMDYCLNLIIESHFKSYRKPIPKFNYVIPSLRKTNKSLYTLVKNYYSTSSIKVKHSLLKKMVQILEKKIGKPSLIWNSTKKFS